MPAHRVFPDARARFLATVVSLAALMIVQGGCASQGDRTSDEAITPPPLPRSASNFRNGFQALGGFWDGWCGDSQSNFLTDPSGYGIMRSNADAYHLINSNGATASAGYFSFDIYFPTDRIPGEGGGKHLAGPSSATVAFGDARPYAGWLRPDITIRSDWRVHVYNLDGAGRPWYDRGGAKDVVCDTWVTGIQIAGVKQWIPVRLDWRRTAPNKLWMKFTASGQSAEHTVTIHPESKNSKLVYFGNVDGLSAFGGTPSLYLRNIRWGQ